MKFETFAVEQWMDEYETSAKYNIAETCCASISVEQLTKLSDQPVPPEALLSPSTKQDYGSIRGSTSLRSCLSALYSTKSNTKLPDSNVLITQGAISANLIVFMAHLGPGDHAICHYPTYQQLYEVPRMLGAEVDYWKARPEKQWVLDIEELKSLVKDNTKMIILNNPHNPTGTVLKKPLLQQVQDFAEEKGLILMSDEVYRPIFHSMGPADADFPPSVLTMPYERSIVTGSLSKAYSLAGVRVGWIASRSKEIIDRCAAVRHYTTISVSKYDQDIASYALYSSTLSNLLNRNIKLAKTNLEILERFVNTHRNVCDWTRPQAGTTAFIKFTRNGSPVDSVEFCKKLQEETGVMLLPGTCFGEEFKGYVRFGFVPETEVLQKGIQELEGFVGTHYESIPTV